MTPFDDLALTWLGNLVEDFGLTLEQAAGILGNLGFESAGFTEMQEVGVKPPKGGLGAAQWTADRRRAFEKWAADHQLATSSDEANYGFLRWELQNTHKHSLEQLKKTTNAEAAVFTFGYFYERPGGTTKTHLPGFDGRLAYAKRAMDLAPKPIPDNPPDDLIRMVQGVFAGLALYQGPIDGKWNADIQTAYAALGETMKS